MDAGAFQCSNHRSKKQPRNLRTQKRLLIRHSVRRIYYILAYLLLRASAQRNNSLAGGFRTCPLFRAAHPPVKCSACWAAHITAIGTAHNAKTIFVTGCVFVDIVTRSCAGLSFIGFMTFWAIHFNSWARAAQRFALPALGLVAAKPSKQEKPTA